MTKATKIRNSQLSRCTRVNNVYRTGCEYYAAIVRTDPFQDGHATVRIRQEDRIVHSVVCGRLLGRKECTQPYGHAGECA